MILVLRAWRLLWRTLRKKNLDFHINRKAHMAYNITYYLVIVFRIDYLNSNFLKYRKITNKYFAIYFKIGIQYFVRQKPNKICDKNYRQELWRINYLHKNLAILLFLQYWSYLKCLSRLNFPINNGRKQKCCLKKCIKIIYWCGGY